jgi:hypothetical protein
MKQDVLNFLATELGLGPDDTQSLYDSFMSSFGELVADLRKAASDDEMELRRITHSIIGFSQNVGALDLFEEAKTLNACAKAKDVPGAAAGAARIIALYEAYTRE